METKKVTLTKVARYTTNKEGQPLMSKMGKPYTSVRIQCAEYPNEWLSGFGSAQNAAWKEGDSVEILIEQKGQYKNFSIPKKEDVAIDKLETILNRITSINLRLANIEAFLKPKDNGLTSAGTKVPDFSEVDNVDESQIPF